MLEKSVFTKSEIIEQLKKQYNIIVKKIEIELRGSANIFYIYDEENIKFVLKEFESKINSKNIIKEIQITNHLKDDGLKVPEYIKTVNNTYFFEYKNRIIILMKFIEGYTKESNTGTYKQVIESAEIYGKTIKSMEKMKNIDFPEENIEKWCNGKKLEESKIKIINLLNKCNELIEENNPNKKLYIKIKSDIEFKLSIIEKIEKIDLSEIENLTMKNSHGDFSVMQFIYKDEKVVALLDFAKARKMPIVWEIIRSYTYIDEKCKDSYIDEDNLNDYIKKVMEYTDLNEFDLKWMKCFYLIQLVTSTFGYKEFFEDNKRTDLLKFGFWRCNMCRCLSEKIRI